MHSNLCCKEKSPKVNLTYLYRTVITDMYRYQGDRILCGTGSRDNWKFEHELSVAGFFVSW